MAVPLEVKNDHIEYYMYLIFVKLAVLLGLKVFKTAYKIHATYRKSMKKKYESKDIEAIKPRPGQS